jgi:hypothetical protein
MYVRARLWAHGFALHLACLAYIHRNFLEGPSNLDSPNGRTGDEHNVGGADCGVVDVMLLLTNGVFFLILN